MKAVIKTKSGLELSHVIRCYPEFVPKVVKCTHGTFMLDNGWWDARGCFELLFIGSESESKAFIERSDK